MRSGSRRLVPAYLVVPGNLAADSWTASDGAALDRLTVLYSVSSAPPRDLPSEQLKLWEVLQPGALTVVDAAALLGLPVSATCALAAALLHTGAAAARRAIPHARRPDRQILERLLVGLRAL